MKGSEVDNSFETWFGFGSRAPGLFLVASQANNQTASLPSPNFFLFYQLINGKRAQSCKRTLHHLVPVTTTYLFEVFIGAFSELTP